MVCLLHPSQYIQDSIPGPSSTLITSREILHALFIRLHSHNLPRISWPCFNPSKIVQTCRWGEALQPTMLVWRVQTNVVQAIVSLISHYLAFVALAVKGRIVRTGVIDGDDHPGIYAESNWLVRPSTYSNNIATEQRKGNAYNRSPRTSSSQGCPSILMRCY